MDEQEEIAFLGAVTTMCCTAYRVLLKKKRRWWVRPLYQERSSKGFYETTFTYMKKHDPDQFFKATRMTKMQFKLLLDLIEQRLTKRSVRQPIEPECRLVLTLTYLSQGCTIRNLASTFRMGTSTVRQIVLEVCQLLWEILSPKYMRKLDTVDWKIIGDEFNHLWNMPHCVGSIGGKHIEIKSPKNAGSKYMNYKDFNSIVLLGTCDANYTFTAVDVEACGSHSNADIFQNSFVRKQMFGGVLELPPPQVLPDSINVAPYYFVGDGVFPLREDLMQPYPAFSENIAENEFNFRLLRAQRTIENSFGILGARWQILGNVIEFHPINVKKVVLACTILHNFLKITDWHSYCPESFCDLYDTNGERVDGMWRHEIKELLSIKRSGSNQGNDEAYEVRNILTSYFCNEGKITFQTNC